MSLRSRKKNTLTIHHIFALLRVVVAIMGAFYCYTQKQQCTINIFAYSGIFFLIYSSIIVYLSFTRASIRDKVYAISAFWDISLMMFILYWENSLHLNIYFAAYLLVVMHALYFGIRFAAILLLYTTSLYLGVLGNTILQFNIFDFVVRMASGISLTLMVGFIAEQMKYKTKTILSLNKSLLKEIRKKEQLLTELREKKTTLASLYSFSQLLSSVTETRDIFQQVIDFVSAKMKNMRFSILIKRNSGWHLAATSANMTLKDNVDISCFGVSLAGKMSEQGNTIFLNNQKMTKPGKCWFTEDDDPHPCSLQCGFANDSAGFDIHHSNKLIIPIQVGQSIFGALIVITSANQELSGGEISFFKSLTNQMSLALEKAVVFKKLKKSSETDPLTGVYNRGKLQNVAAAFLDQAQKEETPLSIVFIDLDHFKSINDENGHQVGDIVLVQLAQKLENSLRSNDIVGRYGGEEFVLLLPQTSKQQAVHTAEKIRAIIEDFCIDIPEKDKKICLTISCGVAAFPEDDINVDILMAKADEALYLAKQEGRNRVESYQPKEKENDNAKNSAWFENIFQYIDNSFWGRFLIFFCYFIF